MVSSTIDLVRFEAFDGMINIDLFNDIIHFVLLLSDRSESEKNAVRRELADCIIWFNENNQTDFQNKYNFRYLGELLERYEDRFKEGIKDLRAIALVLAYVQPFLSANMFVGSQQKDFIKKVGEHTENDIYLSGALYLIDMAQKGASAWLSEREIKPFKKTEELLFFLSLYPQIETGYAQTKVGLVQLLGTGRTIPVIHNIGIYCWLIRRFHAIFKADRKKDAALFKALCALPVSFVKDDSPQYKALITCGYTPQEIVYANYAVLYSPTVPNSLEKQSMVTEKIAISFCKTIIEAPDPQVDDTYELLYLTLRQYETFPIRCYGFEGIIKAIEAVAKCECPQTFIKLSSAIKYSDLYRFDILDNKWDILAAELTPKRYLEFFDSQLLDDYRTEALLKEDVQARIDVYERLTGVPYIQTFDEERGHRWDNFDLLVKCKIAILEELFFLYVNGDYSEDMVEYIWTFVRGIHNRESFEFFRWLFTQYGQSEISDTLESYSSRFSDDLFTGRRHYHNHSTEKEISVLRDFLTPEENRLVLEWLDVWIYQYSSSKYIDFVVCVLLDEFASSLFSKDEIRELYDLVIENKASELKTYEVQSLKQRFLSEAELQSEFEAERKLELERKLLQEEQQKKEIHDKFEESFNGTYQSVNAFLDKYRYSREEYAHQLVSDTFNRIYAQTDTLLTKEELSYFFKVCSVLTDSGHLSLSRIKTYLQKIDEKEVAA